MSRTGDVYILCSGVLVCLFCVFRVTTDLGISSNKGVYCINRSVLYMVTNVEQLQCVLTQERNTPSFCREGWSSGNCIKAQLPSRKMELRELY